MTATARLELDVDMDTLSLEAIRRDPAAVIFASPGASLVDIGDAVLCLEFHSKGNTLNDDTLTTAEEAYRVIPGNYRGLVIGNQGVHFSFGTDLRWLIEQADANRDDRQGFYEGLKRAQRVITGLRTAPFPTIAATFGLTYGSALELAMFCDRVQTHGMLSMRFPEIAFGLLPTLGGTSEMYARSVEHFGVGHSQEALRFAFDAIVSSYQSIDADDACARLFLNETDRMTPHIEDLLLDAKARVRYLAEGYQPPLHRKNVHVLGAMGFRTLEAVIEADMISGQLNGHDIEVALAVARVMTGGAEGLPRVLEQEELFDLEAQELTSLMFHPKTRERIEHLLVTGKPLRN